MFLCDTLIRDPKTGTAGPSTISLTNASEGTLALIGFIYISFISAELLGTI